MLVRTALVAVLGVTACTPTPTASPTPIASSAGAAPVVAPAAPRTAAPSAVPAALPIAIAADPRAGVIFAPGFRFDGATGQIEVGSGGTTSPDAREVWVTERTALFRIGPQVGSEVHAPANVVLNGSAAVSADGMSSAFVSGRDLYVDYRGGGFTRVAPGRYMAQALWSPDNRHLALMECLVCGTIVGETRLDLYDAATGALTFFYEAPQAVRYGDTMPLEVRGLANLAWSPDGRYLAGSVENWIGRPEQADAALGHARALLVFDTRTAVTWTLGRVLNLNVTYGAPDPWFVWGIDHALAYVAGDDASTWANKTLRIWTPERGSVEVARGAVYSPSWDENGALYFAVSTSPVSTPNNLLAQGPNETAIDKVDREGRRVRVANVNQLHAVRASRDGTVLLYSATDFIGMFTDGRATSLLRFDAGGGYLTTPSLRWLAWDR
jgi:hypothetical protein